MYIGNDTGPMHIAAAAGVAVVAVFCHPIGGDALSAYSPARFAPVGVPSRIVRPATATPPCTSACVANEPHCITAVTVDEVLAAVWELREEWERKFG
jgi:ADP-heptose:LPS heptosyltransferase